MISRPIWNERLEAAWKQVNIVWLTGPRRVGKTVLAQSVTESEYLNLLNYQPDPELLLPGSRRALRTLEGAGAGGRRKARTS